MNSGRDSAQIYGYGFGSDPAKISVTIGGANAIVQKVEGVTSIASSLGLDATYPFSLERITLQTPPGSSGKADVLVSTPAGSATSAKAFQYLQSVQSYSKPALFKFLFYDQKRQRLYLTNVDHVDVFDLQQNIFLAPLLPPGGPPPTAGLRGLAQTPEGSQLVVADFGSHNIYLLDPVTGTGTAVPVGGVPGFTNSGPARVAATSTQTVFVGLSGEGAPRACVQLAAVPLGTGAITPSAVPAGGGATLTIRGSGFQSATTLSINGKTASVTFKDSNTLLVVTPALALGPQQITLTNPDGETVSLDAALFAN